MRDGGGDARHAGRVDVREVAARLYRDAVLDGDLAAEVRQEDAVGGAADLKAGDALQRVDDLAGVLGVLRADGDVAHHAAAVRLDEVDRADVAARHRR